MYNLRRSWRTPSVRWYLLICVSFGTFLVITANMANDTNGSCYLFFPYLKLTWNKSLTTCSKDGGSLVSMETEKEWQFINAHVQERNFSNNLNEWFIGLTNSSEKWMWTSNKPLTIEKWQTKVEEPNGDGRCAVMARNFSQGNHSLFKDVDCMALKMFICEYDESLPKCRDTILHCCNKNLHPVYRVNATNNTSLSLSDTATLGHDSKSSRTALLVFACVLGIVLVACSVVYFYVFCCRAYEPGYQGYGRETYAKKSKPTDDPDDNVSYCRTETLECVLEDSQDEIMEQTTNVVDDNETCGPSTHADSSENQRDEQKNFGNQAESTVIYVQIHNLETLQVKDSHPSSVGEQNTQVQISERDTVVYSKIKRRLDSRGESPNIASTQASIDCQRSNSTSAIDEAAALDTVVTDAAALDTVTTDAVAMESVATDDAAIDDIVTNAVAMDVVAMDTVATDDVAMDTVATDDVAMDTVATGGVTKYIFQRHNTWANSSYMKTAAQMQSLVNEEKDIPRDASRDHQLIYATVDKSKKTRRPTNTDHVVYTKVKFA